MTFSQPELLPIEFCVSGFINLQSSVFIFLILSLLLSPFITCLQRTLLRSPVILALYLSSLALLLFIPFLPLVTFHMHYLAEWLLFVCLFVFNLVSSPRDLSCCELFLSWASVLFHHHTTDGRHGLPPLLSCSVWPRAVYSHLSGMLFTGSLQDLQWPLCFPGLCGRPLAYDHRWPQVPRDTGKPTPPPIFHHRHTLLAHYQSLPAP